MTLAQRIALAWRFARRELRGGLKSFRVFLLCLALGVGGVAAVGSVVAAIKAGLAQEGSRLIGGDVAVELTYRRAEPEERAALEALGAVSEILDFRGMARTEGGDSALVQTKTVDAAYPLYGSVGLEPAMPLAEALAVGPDGRPGAVAEPALMTRLDLKIGDPVKLGDETFTLRAALISEPDRVSGGIDFGPRFLFSSDALAATGLVKPGTLYETEYRVALPDGADPDAVRAELEQAYPDDGWRLRDRSTGAPGVARFVDRIGAFLTLVGLAALAVGGVGVGASVRNYLEQKTETIATLKTLGADGPTIVWTYLLQIGVLAALGVGIGMVLGAVGPLLAAPILAERLPTPTVFAIYPQPLLEAGLYGALAAMIFALWPLGRAREVRAAGLFRDIVSPTTAAPRLVYLIAIAALAAALTAAAVVFTDQWRLSLGFVGGVGGALVVLTLAAWAVSALARWLARTRLARGRLPLRLALSGVGGPDGAGAGETRGAVLALGLGLAVLTAIGLVDHNLRRLVSETLPDNAPNLFAIDIQNAELQGFLETSTAMPGVETIETAPMLRGVITKLNGMTAKEWRESGKIEDGGDWVIRGDRGVTYAAEPPKGAEITEGEWWPADYAGPPLVSFGDSQGRGLGLQVGDSITVNVLGREITAEIANFRRVEFRDMGINFVMLFNPAVLQGAPHVHIATLYGEEPAPGAYLKTIANAFPAVSVIRVEDAAASFSKVLGDVAMAARAGAAATLITGLVVLIGATAAGQRRQIYDAAILKTLGATRGALLAAMTLRSALLGVAASVVAIGAGALGSWAVLTFVMEAEFAFDPFTAGAIVAGGVAATLIAGAAFAYAPLSARPARILRARE